MKTKNNRPRQLLALAFFSITASAWATPVPIDTGNPNNGIFDIFSTTFDGSTVPCGGGSPPYCSFFNGDPPVNRALTIVPNPTGVIDGVPGGITSAPSASFLDLALSNGNTQLTIASGAAKFAALTIIISAGTPSETVVLAENAGFVFDTAAQVTSIDGNGVAEFLVSLAPATAVDFSTFSQVVTSCTGPLCGLIPILTLDMIRYRLLIDYDPTFTSFTGSLIGQTANNSMVFATLHSLPEITVTDSVAPADDLDVPFGQVTENTVASQTITVDNDGSAPLVMGNVATANPLAAPFSIGTDNCSGIQVAAGGSCTIQVLFSPTAAGTFTDSLDIPSNDAAQSQDGAEPSITVDVSGEGTVALIPNIAITDSLGSATDQALPFGTVAAGSELLATVTVENTGTGDLSIGSVATANALAAPFNIASDTCSSQVLLPAATCTIGVRFAPGAAGGFSDSFDIPSDDPDTPSATVSTSGTGTVDVPIIRVNDATAPPEDLDFSFSNVRQGDSFDRTVTIVNDGTADLVIGTIGGTNALAAPFSLVAGEDDCSGQTLVALATCTLRLRFSPTVLGDASDSVNIPSNDDARPNLTLSMDGTGVVDPPPDDIEPDGADSGFMALDELTLALLGGAAWVAGRRRRCRSGASRDGI
ncbi:MAG: choice-of-anchor D domain-containing protein [Gammaproteobacteria bacterium]|nr:choice-of-anchor D domain-containing protein [Gammaproteobacteria bacterium]